MTPPPGLNTQEWTAPGPRATEGARPSRAPPPQDNAPRGAAYNLGAKDWKAITRRVLDRTNAQCLHHCQ